MNILICNDDGWNADGLQCLVRIARRLGKVWIVAPASPQSGISHQLTLNRPLQLIEQQENWFSLDGTPADCARIGLTQLAVEFDWAFSGINHGANLGSDQFVSGTVAAAREATLFGVPAVAFSQYRKDLDNPFDWGPTEQLAAMAIESILNKPNLGKSLFNVNFPDRSPDLDWDSVEVVECRPDQNPLPSAYSALADGSMQYSGSYHDRKRSAGHDIDVCFSGHVALSRLA